MEYGVLITRKGWNLLAKAVAGEMRLEITRVMVGKGMAENLGTEIEDLVEPVAQATSTRPIVKDKTVSFIVEYRNDLNGGLDEGFYLSEFGVYALDPQEDEILLFYGSLADKSQYVSPAMSGSIEVRRFPMSVALTDELEVIIAYPPLAFMTYEDTEIYVMETALPVILGRVGELISEHNVSPEAHPDMRVTDSSHDARIRRLEDMLVNDVTGNPYLITFGDLDGVIATGVWNKTLARIEF